MAASLKDPKLTLIINVRLPLQNYEQTQNLWTIICEAKRVTELVSQSKIENPSDIRGEEVRKIVDAQGSLLLSSLCHAHIHLDKCFLMDHCEPLVTGTFKEAMTVTAKVKERFPVLQQDLIERGRKVIKESVECGVTTMRAHVEIDATVGMVCLETGVRLRSEWLDICDVQVVAFMQDPMFHDADSSDPGPNVQLLHDAASRCTTQAVGSAPYVEPSVDLAKRNIDIVLALAQQWNLHVDFHLDYNVSPNMEPLVFYVLGKLRATGWGGITRSDIGRGHMHVTLGHCTRLTIFTPAQWDELRTAMAGLPVSLVGLPQSDLYMMGRTLNVPQIRKEHGVRIAMGVNNVQNAFTPQGSVDPLGLCPLAVAAFQSGTARDMKVLLEAVTSGSRQAIGIEPYDKDDAGVFPALGQNADFVLLHGAKTLHDAVLNPPFDRTTIRGGRVVSCRRSRIWNALDALP